MAASYLFLGLLLLHVIPLLHVTAQSPKNLTSGSAITAGDPTTHLLSPSGEFAFGFQMIGSAFLLAVWFERIPDKTVVWSANGNKLVPRGSKAQLTKDGRFVVDTPKSEEILSFSQPGAAFVYASLQDTGNLVLGNSDHVELWSTFDQPTDTLLPTQVLAMSATLYARYSETNYSRGRFALSMQADGTLKLMTTPFPIDYLYQDYWTANPDGGGSQLVFNQTGQVYVAASNGTVLAIVFSSNTSTNEFYQRVVVDHDGIFRLYVYPKTTNLGGRWPTNWTTPGSASVPPNICLSLVLWAGSGPCGFNSYCIMGEDQRPKCECPSGYVWLDPDDESKGCRPDFMPHSCDKNKAEGGDMFKLVEMANTDWPRLDYEYFRDQTEDWCRRACLEDCMCAVAVYADSVCMKKKMPLTNGRKDYNVREKSLVKVRILNSTADPPGYQQKTKVFSTMTIVSFALLSGSVSFNLLLLVVMLIIWRKFRYGGKDTKANSQLTEEINGMRLFSYSELWKATNQFKEELGRGAFGMVYKGFLPSSLGREGHNVAVKVLYKLNESAELEFKREISAISQTNHKNLVRLLGYCNEDRHRILVYEYMSNSCLANFLFGDSRPSWYMRIEIAQGVARGLAYLHDECSTQMIHCDIKPQNILLDDALKAKISDFGLAKLLVADQTQTLTELRGTKGYVAPEWFRNLPISAKVDVYSFGVLLLELICCRKNYKAGKEEEAEMILADWVCDCFHENTLNMLVEDDQEAAGDQRRVERFVRTALWCIQEDPSQRPTMKKVILMLEGAVPVPVPPDPCSFISSI
ncbi:hypothetical protein MLD38_011790 [Melastoma candidum]|uniref:Uncharacterized protein n=1 Tax=Melastoma candidum TaxID=119954 RepID=A0ACB9R3T5_9MYRT|nr:hypothetical protein MLD38_011790 [Melastoma candidum]